MRAAASGEQGSSNRDENIFLFANRIAASHTSCADYAIACGYERHRAIFLPPA